MGLVWCLLKLVTKMMKWHYNGERVEEELVFFVCLGLCFNFSFPCFLSILFFLVVRCSNKEVKTLSYLPS